MLKLKFYSFKQLLKLIIRINEKSILIIINKWQITGYWSERYLKIKLFVDITTSIIRAECEIKLKEWWTWLKDLGFR